jgi:hypothetical protein
MFTSKDVSDLEQIILETMKAFTDLLASISEKDSNEVNQILWKIRAELEMIVIELKSLISDSILKEKWQEDFHKNFKGTKSKDKAIKKLQEYNLNEIEIKELSSKKRNECYQFLWKLKEVISGVISAFPETRFSWVDNQLQEEKEKIFEI